MSIRVTETGLALWPKYVEIGPHRAHGADSVETWRAGHGLCAKRVASARPDATCDVVLRRQTCGGAAVLHLSSFVTFVTLNLFIPPPVESPHAAQRLVDAMALPPTAVSHLAFSGRDRLAIDAGISHRKPSPISRPCRVPRVGTPRVSRGRHEFHSHASSTSLVAGVDDAFPERLSCGGVDELRDTSMASLQRIETHEYEGSDAQARRTMLWLFACGRRKISEFHIAKTREGQAALGTYWHMQESKLSKGQGTRQLSGLKRQRRAAPEKWLESAGAMTPPRERAFPAPSHPADPYATPPDDERGELEAVVSHKVHRSGRATWIKLECRRVSGKKRWETWEWEVEVQRTDNAAVLTYWYHVRRPQVTSRYFQIVGHVGEGERLCFKVQWVGYTACRDVKGGLVDVTLEPAIKVKNEYYDEYCRYASVHKLEI
ncbi:hypothetical protein Purlil1_12728 [Purpureocillium lilacinum]|uniref:Chromo domain-containing protein n=1 Tax=Purpureocillium lilacinum TaxID=33203 RepID=A0ABR0BG32_PURLI|nr:hypothetical protein Purlil1_12728 [Purpureocillium lilacinum]